MHIPENVLRVLDAQINPLATTEPLPGGIRLEGESMFLYPQYGHIVWCTPDSIRRASRVHGPCDLASVRLYRALVSGKVKVLDIHQDWIIIGPASNTPSNEALRSNWRHQCHVGEYE